MERLKGHWLKGPWLITDYTF